MLKIKRYSRLKVYIRHAEGEDVDKSEVAEHSSITKRGILFVYTKGLESPHFTIVGKIWRPLKSIKEKIV